MIERPEVVIGRPSRVVHQRLDQRLRLKR